MKEPMKISPSDRYYIQDSRTFVGNCVVFWGPNGAGYTCHLDNAGIYSLEEARSRTERESDLFIPVEDIQPIASLMVDMQRLRRIA